jgi:uncharacterized protein (DUF1684 family)
MIAVVAFVISACSTATLPDAKDYAAKLTADRAAKDKAFASTDDPVPTVRHAALLPLVYFPIDADYDVPAALKPAESSAIMKMPTSTGTQRDMRRVGTLEFSLKGQPLKLTAFIEVGAKDLNRLFVPFTDATRGTETYPGGRYLDLDRTATNLYDLDFNRAYNPYCYFNITYECPLPPAENRLNVRVTAGEEVKTEK